MRIYYLDDEPDIREIVAAALALDPGLDVETFATGSALLARLATTLPDLLVLDIMMPDADGPAILAQLRRDSRTAPIPIVFATARVRPADLARYEALGALGTIQKPFDPLTLAARLRAMAGRSL